MFMTLTVLTVLITLMFVGSVFSALVALRDEARENRLDRRPGVF